MKKNTITVPSVQLGEPLLNVREAANYLRVCEKTVGNLRRANALAFIAIGRAIRFEPSALAAYANSRRVNVA